MGSQDHQNRRDTERQHYDRLRREGVNPDAAKKIAEDSSTQAHRSIDRRNSSAHDRVVERKKNTGRAR